ncbi:unnamed protein product [Schistocephalus solidus]|uniref:Uncharacterized protein n=1 Tax=Schistocephalus solidus TaxID=70667 RepID=A0A183TDI1_SCHSO|nr:unnamed protein product [Schistocephalus solidus]
MQNNSDIARDGVVGWEAGISALENHNASQVVSPECASEQAVASPSSKAQLSSELPSQRLDENPPENAATRCTYYPCFLNPPAQAARNPQVTLVGEEDTTAMTAASTATSVPQWQPKLFGYWSLQENFGSLPSAPVLSGTPESQGLLDMFLPSLRCPSWSHESTGGIAAYSSRAGQLAISPDCFHYNEPSAFTMLPGLPSTARGPSDMQDQPWSGILPLEQTEQSDSEGCSSSVEDGDETGTPGLSKSEEFGNPAYAAAFPSSPTSSASQNLVVSGRFQLQLEVQARVRNRCVFGETRQTTPLATPVGAATGYGPHCLLQHHHHQQQQLVQQQSRADRPYCSLSEKPNSELFHYQQGMPPGATHFTESGGPAACSVPLPYSSPGAGEPSMNKTGFIANNAD